MARLREEPESDDRSPDKGVPGKFAGHRGYLKTYASRSRLRAERDLCDGQSLASPGRWLPGSRVCPTSEHWRRVSEVFQRFTDHYGT